MARLIVCTTLTVAISLALFVSVVSGTELVERDAIDQDACNPNPCLHRGVCRTDVALDIFVCDCPDGFLGQTCEMTPEFNPENLRPCIGEDGIFGGCATPVPTPVPTSLPPTHSSTPLPVDPCDPNPCANGGTCANADGDAQCTCKTGFTGSYCDVDQCDPNPCNNGGKCHHADNADGLTCECTNGFTGSRCDIPPNPCTPNPCKNGAECSNVDGDATCQCAAGYGGTRCQIDKCDPNPCNNGGKCHHADNADGLTCECTNGFTGSRCDVAPDPCAPNPCENNAECSVDSGFAKCKCKPGFSGVRCQNIYNICVEAQPCFNNATCTVTEGLDYTCTCLPGFEGRTCKNVINPCKGPTCGKNGVCVATGPNNGDFRCDCALGWTGATCDQETDPCHPSPCQNQGECSIVNGFPKCKCAPGWTGSRCTVVYDICAQAKPCNNNATCVWLGGLDYRCDCQPGYEGRTCKNAINPCSRINCGVHGECEATGPNYGNVKCNCEDGWTGVFCTVPSNPCLPTPCQNGGECSVVNGFPKCKCAPGWTGSRCNVEYDICLQARPCLNNGVCVRLGGLDYRCDCQPGYEGRTCKSKIDPCSRGGCGKNGVCVATGINYGDFRCDCKKGYTGQFCNVDEDECAAGVCKNFARCVNSRGGYTCFCRPGTSGTNCDVVANACLKSPCAAGSLCEPSIFSDTKCVCAAGKAGSTCDQSASPSYTLAALSSIQVRAVARDSLSSVTLAFRTLNPAGLLFAHGASADDAFAVILNGGDVSVIVSGGEITLRAQNGGSFADGEWHTLRITDKSATERTVSVDGFSKTVAYGGWANANDVHIGFVALGSNDIAGFSGCIKDVIIGGKALSALSETVFSHVRPGCADSAAFSFAGKSYVNFDASLEGPKSSLSITFRTLSQSRMLLVHQGLANMRLSGYVDAGKLSFFLNLGRGDGSLTLDYFVADGDWHTVVVTRDRHIATVNIDGAAATGTFRSLGQSRQFAPFGQTMVGGNRKGSYDLVTGAPGFQGCISEVTINGNAMQINSAGAVKVTACASAEIFSLDGNGYVQGTPYSPADAGSVQLRFRASSPTGILAYAAENSAFYILELFDGRVRAAFDTGNGLAEGSVGVNLADGFWHTVTFTRTKNDAVVSVDGDVAELHAPGIAHLLNVNTALYVGGHPGLVNGPIVGSHSNVGFVGCVSRVVAGTGAVISGDFPTLRVNTLLGCPALSNDLTLRPDATATFHTLPTPAVDGTSLRFAIRATLSTNTLANQDIAVLTSESGDTIAIKFTSYYVSATVNIGGVVVTVGVPNRPFVVDGQWHTVNASVRGGMLQLAVDDLFTTSAPLEGFTAGKLSFGSATLDACIRDIVVNGKTASMQAASFDGEVSTGCSALTGVYF